MSFLNQFHNCQKSKGDFTAVGKKRQHCGTCTGCSSSDCGQCKYYIDKPKFSGLGKERQHCEKKHCLNSDGEITQHAIEKDADSKTFTLSTVSYICS